jgi:hypothetical protein
MFGQKPNTWPLGALPAFFLILLYTYHSRVYIAELYKTTKKAEK